MSYPLVNIPPHAYRPEIVHAPQQGHTTAECPPGQQMWANAYAYRCIPARPTSRNYTGPNPAQPYWEMPRAMSMSPRAQRAMSTGFDGNNDWMHQYPKLEAWKYEHPQAVEWLQHHKGEVQRFMAEKGPQIRLWVMTHPEVAQKWLAEHPHAQEWVQQNIGTFL
jgi:hypothetical protein